MVVFYDYFDALRLAVFEIEGVVGIGVGGEPIFAVNLLAIGFEFGELLVFAVLQMPVARPKVLTICRS